LPLAPVAPDMLLIFLCRFVNLPSDRLSMGFYIRDGCHLIAGLARNNGHTPYRVQQSELLPDCYACFGLSLSKVAWENGINIDIICQVSKRQ
jgi:hypothetical protein